MNDGLKRIEPMLRPIHEALGERNRQGDFHQADETRGLVFVLLDGKKGHGWWLWVIFGADAVNRERLRHPRGSAKFQEQDALLHRAVEATRAEAVRELSQPPAIPHDVAHRRLLFQPPVTSPNIAPIAGADSPLGKSPRRRVGRRFTDNTT